MIAFKAHFDGKHVVPDEPVELPAGRQLNVQIELAQPEAASKKYSALDFLESNPVDSSALPADLSVNHDHYLYGTPKKER